MNNINDNMLVQKCNNFGTALADGDYLPASASFIDVSGLDRFAFVIGVGTLDTATTFAVFQDTSATATGSIKAITGASQVVAATDDNKWLTIEVTAANIDQDNSFRYVTLKASGPAGSNDFACVFFLGWNPRKAPVTQPSDYAYAVEVI